MSQDGKPAARHPDRAGGVSGRGRPQIGSVVELRLPADLLAAVESEATALGWKRAELLRWIVAERYSPEHASAG
jgi:hypothetical protein